MCAGWDLCRGLSVGTDPFLCVLGQLTTTVLVFSLLRQKCPPPNVKGGEVYLAHSLESFHLIVADSKAGWRGRRASQRETVHGEHKAAK